MKKKIVIIGGGFSSLSAASYLAKAGQDVSIYEKNTTLGGRARQLKKEGFTFDMGPSWYWMPDVFESFFNDFGKSVTDYYSLQKLDPGYKVYFGKNESISISASIEKIYETFDVHEKGSGEKLRKFIKKAQEHYDIAIKDLVHRPGISPLELITPVTIKKIRYFISTIKREVEKEFHNPKLRQILQFPVLFLGAKPSQTPAFYNFMNYADFGLGTWHPDGGMYRIVEGMIALAASLGVQMHTKSTVEAISVNEQKAANGILVNNEFVKADIILSGADYNHSETLLPPKFRQYSEAYWQKKVFAPSSLLFYVGLNKKINKVSHHTLFFDVDFDVHATAIYDDPKWPEAPLFYANFPSITDPSMAPDGKEACFILIPIAPGIDDNEQLREIYFEKVMTRLEMLTEQKIREAVLFNESFCLKEFVDVYNSYKGNAYGMANTLLQTAFLRPKLKSKKVKNLYFTGQLTVPGPGVPPALISGKLVADLIQKG